MLNPQTLNKGIVDKYLEGFKSGVEWPDRWEDHKPGGPYVSGSKFDGGQSARENEAWKLGWEDGHALKIKVNKIK